MQQLTNFFGRVLLIGLDIIVFHGQWCANREGGLGIKSFKVMNEAHLAKLGWTLVASDNKMWSRILKAKYFPYFYFLECQGKHNCSWIWEGIFESKNVLLRGASYKIGSNNSMNIWHDPLVTFWGIILWLPYFPSFKPALAISMQDYSYDPVSSLKHLNGEWDHNKLYLLFVDNFIQHIKCIHWVQDGLEDKIIWVYDRVDEFSVKSAYLLASSFSHSWLFLTFLWKVLWKSHIFECHKLLLWRLAINGMPVRKKLKDRL